MGWGKRKRKCGQDKKPKIKKDRDRDDKDRVWVVANGGKSGVSELALDASG